MTELMATEAREGRGLESNKMNGGGRVLQWAAINERERERGREEKRKTRVDSFDG